MAWHPTEAQDPFYKTVRVHTVKSHGISKLQDRILKFLYCFGSWYAPPQHCCGDAYQLSKRSEKSKIESRGFEISWEFMTTYNRIYVHRNRTPKSTAWSVLLVCVPVLVEVVLLWFGSRDKSHIPAISLGCRVLFGCNSYQGSTL